MSFVFLQSCRCITKHYHGGGLLDDCHQLQLGGVSVCGQSRAFLCWPKLWLPAAAAGVPDYTSLRGKYAKKQRNHECTCYVHNLQNASKSRLLIQCFSPKSKGIFKCLKPFSSSRFAYILAFCGNLYALLFVMQSHMHTCSQDMTHTLLHCTGSLWSA